MPLPTTPALLFWLCNSSSTAQRKTMAVREGTSVWLWNTCSRWAATTVPLGCSVRLRVRIYLAFTFWLESKELKQSVGVLPVEVRSWRRIWSHLLALGFQLESFACTEISAGVICLHWDFSWSQKLVQSFQLESGVCMEFSAGVICLHWDFMASGVCTKFSVGVSSLQWVFSWRQELALSIQPELT